MARAQIGCHYVNGAAGNTPGMNDGAWYRPSAVKMYPNSPNPQGADGKDGRRVPIIQAAYCTIRGFCVCGGRSAISSVKALPIGDYDAEEIILDDYKWPRPDKFITSTKTIHGESCEGIRHFDCIGLVNWCLAEVAKKDQLGIEGLAKKKQKAIDDGKTLLTLADVRAGDLLVKGITHIAIATGDNTVVEASGYTRGVKETHIKDDSEQDGAGWDYIHRLSDWYWK